MAVIGWLVHELSEGLFGAQINLIYPLKEIYLFILKHLGKVFVCIRIAWSEHIIQYPNAPILTWPSISHELPIHFNSSDQIIEGLILLYPFRP